LLPVSYVQTHFGVSKTKHTSWHIGAPLPTYVNITETSQFAVMDTARQINQLGSIIDIGTKRFFQNNETFTYPKARSIDTYRY